MSVASLAVALVAVQATPVQLKVDVAKQIGPISPYIYGTNQPDWTGLTRYLTLWRWGGNRISAYNWETNASNAGTDWFNQNDDYLGGGETPALAVRQHMNKAYVAGAGALITVPMTGHVAADKNGGGDVNQTPNYLQTRFNDSLANKPTALRTTPTLTDNLVYQDEFVHHLRQKYATQTLPLWFALDNEPDLWFYTHPRITPNKPTYASIMATSKLYAEAIKKVAPASLVFGPASYGWQGYFNLQDASDANGRFFLDYYLAAFKAMEAEKGKRFLDVLDLHWYPEARGGGKRITENGTEQGLYQARMQAPRSLWDPTYTEDSWIAQWGTQGPVQLLPLIKGKIAKKYPGTKLAFTEWNYGGGDHITGAIAVADVLGIFGRDGVFASTYWHLNANESFAYGGFMMFRNFDKAGGHFGDVAVGTVNPDREKFSTYAAVSSTDPTEMTFVVINKQFTTASTALKISNGRFASVTAYQLTGASSKPVVKSVTFTPTTITATLPATSITTYKCKLN